MAVLVLCEKVDPEFIARAAIYARERGFMKDMRAVRRCFRQTLSHERTWRMVRAADRRRAEAPRAESRL